MDQIRVISVLTEEIALRNENPVVYDHVPISVQFRFRSRDNSWIWFDDKLSVLERDENKMIKLLIGTISKFVPALREDEKSDISLLEQDLISQDGKTYVNLDSILKLQENRIQKNISFSGIIMDSFELTNRELEVFNLILEGFTSVGIGKKINVSKNTVNMHRKQIMKKMQARSVADLFRIALKNQLLLKK